MAHTDTDVLAWLTADDLRKGRTTAAEVAEIRTYLDDTGIDLALVIDFVIDDLSRLYVRQVADINDVVWCPAWWYHLEAIERFGVLRATRGAVDDAEDLSDWWLTHATPHMDALMSYQGPFRGCSARHGHRTVPVPALPITLPEAARPADLAVA